MYTATKIGSTSVVFRATDEGAIQQSDDQGLSAVWNAAWTEGIDHTDSDHVVHEGVRLGDPLWPDALARRVFVMGYTLSKGKA